MSLIFGILAGLAYGLSAFAGAFVMLPLLVLGAGISLHASLPIALFALGIAAAIAAGDAARARQCDIQLAVLLVLGGVPTVAGISLLVHSLDDRFIATSFLVAAIVFGPLLLYTSRAYRHRVAPCPAALLAAPRRGLDEAAAGAAASPALKLRFVVAGALCGVLTASCAAPGSWISWQLLNRHLPGQTFQVVGTQAFSAALLAIVGAGVQFLVAPAIPGYTAGLFVLGTMAGMGLARRLAPWPRLRASNAVVGVLTVVLALALWLSIVNGGLLRP